MSSRVILSVVDLSVRLSVPLSPFSGQPYSGQRVKGVSPMFSAQRHLSLIFQNFKISFGNSSRIEILGISVGSKMAFWAKPSGPPSAVSQPPTSLPYPIQQFISNSTKFFNCFPKNLKYLLKSQRIISNTDWINYIKNQKEGQLIIFTIYNLKSELIFCIPKVNIPNLGNFRNKGLKYRIRAMKTGIQKQPDSRKFRGYESRIKFRLQ